MPDAGAEGGMGEEEREAAMAYCFYYRGKWSGDSYPATGDVRK